MWTRVTATGHAYDPSGVLVLVFFNSLLLFVPWNALWSNLVWLLTFSRVCKYSIRIKKIFIHLLE